MSESKLKIGDIAFLNSSLGGTGPLMTIVSVTKSEELVDPSNYPMGFVRAVWFDDKAQLHQDSFPQECLTLYK